MLNTVDYIVGDLPKKLVNGEFLEKNLYQIHRIALFKTHYKLLNKPDQTLVVFVYYLQVGMEYYRLKLILS